MRQLVDQRNLGAPGEQRRQIELLEHDVLVGDAPPGEAGQAVGLRLGVLARVRLEVADHRVAPRLVLGAQLLQRPVGLADPRGHPEEDLVVTAAGMLAHSA